MDLSMTAAAIAGGLVSGYLAVRTLDSLVGIGFCLHALISARWRRLARKPAINRVRTDTVVNLLIKLILLAALFGVLLSTVYDLTEGATDFTYQASLLITYAVAAGAIFLLRLPATWRRLVFYWRMSHEFDFAEKRNRTMALKR